MKRSKRHLPPYVVEDVARATGQVRLYFRPPRKRGETGPITKIRIYPAVEHLGFWPAYEAAKRGEQLPKPATAPKKRPSGIKTFKMLTREYYQSADFQQLTPDSMRARKSTLERCCEEETVVGSGLFIGDTPVHEFGPDHVKALRDRKRALPEAANNRVKSIRGVFKWHLKGKRGAENPCDGFEKLKPTNPDGFHIWTLDEVKQYEARHPIGTNARLAFDLAFYTAQRKSDVIRVGPAHVKIFDGEAWLSFKQKKTNMLVEIPILEPLAESIAARSMIDGEAFLMASFAKPYSAAGMGLRFRAWCDEAGLAHCSMHGLRKAHASRLAELGVDELGIGSITGHEPGSKEIFRYTRGARRRLMARNAFDKLADSLPKRVLAAGIAPLRCEPDLSHQKIVEPKNGTFTEGKNDE